MQNYSHFGSDDGYISPSTVYFDMSFRHIYWLLFYVIWEKYALNILFNFGLCAENVTDLKNRTVFVW